MQFVRDERQFVTNERQFARDERQFVRGYGVSRERRNLGPPYYRLVVSGIGHMQTVTSHSLFNTDAVNCWQVTIEHGTNVDLLELRNPGCLPLETTDHDMLMIMAIVSRYKLLSRFMDDANHLHV